MPKNALPKATIEELKYAIVVCSSPKDAVARHTWFETRPGFTTRRVLGLPANQAAMANLVDKLGDRLAAPKIAIGSAAFKFADDHIGYQVAGAMQADAEFYRSDAKYLHEFLKRRWRALLKKGKPPSEQVKGKKVKDILHKTKIRFISVAKA